MISKNVKRWFMPLEKVDIDQNIKQNEIDWGWSLVELKELKEHELFLIEREILRDTYEARGSKITTLIQRQNLREQVAHISNRIIREQLNGSISSVNNSLHHENQQS
jgi:hypothetical protein